MDEEKPHSLKIDELNGNFEKLCRLCLNHVDFKDSKTAITVFSVYKDIVQYCQVAMTIADIQVRRQMDNSKQKIEFRIFSDQTRRLLTKAFVQRMHSTAGCHLQFQAKM